MILLLVGLGLIAIQPLTALVRVGLAFVWMMVTAAELRRLQQAYASVAGYRLFADGEIEIKLEHGGSETAFYAAGSVVLPRLAWLRVRGLDGRCWGELIAGNPRKNKEWRRYQVICRQVRAC